MIYLSLSVWVCGSLPKPGPFVSILVRAEATSISSLPGLCMNVRIQTLVIVSVCQVLLLIAGPLLQPRCGNLHKMRNLKTVLRSFRQLPNTVRNKTKTHSAHPTHKVELPISYTSVSPTCHHPLPPPLYIFQKLQTGFLLISFISLFSLKCLEIQSSKLLMMLAELALSAPQEQEP